MTITYVGNASTNLDNTTGGSLSISGIGIQENDGLIWLAIADGDGLAAPTGFSDLINVVSGSSTLSVGYKTANGSETSVGVDTNSGSGERAWACVAVYRGVNPSGLIDNYSNNTGGSDDTAVFNAMTPTKDDCVVIAFIGTDDGYAGNPMIPDVNWLSGFTERNDNINGPPGTGALSAAGAFADTIQTTATSVSGSVVMDNNTTYWSTALVALAPLKVNKDKMFLVF